MFTSLARSVRVESVEVVVPEDDVEGSADGSAEDGLVNEAEDESAGFNGETDGAEREPGTDNFSSSIGDGRLPKGLVTGEVWLFTRAEISRASRWR